MHEKKKWEINNEGRLLKPDFHDGSFYGILLEESDNLLISLKDHQNNHWKIRLEEITLLNIFNFWGGSIIGDIYFLSKTHVSLIAWRKIFGLRLNNKASEEELRKLINKDPSGNFFILDASYGGEIYAACAGMKIFEETKI